MRLALGLLIVALLSRARSQEPAVFHPHEFAITRAEELSEADLWLQHRLRITPERVSAQEEAAYRSRWEPVVCAMEEGGLWAEPLAPNEFGVRPLGLSRPFQGLRGALNATVLEMRRALAEGEPERALELSAAGADFAADLLDQPRLIDQHLALALCFVALPEAWRDEDLERLDAGAAALLDEQLARFEDRLPLRVEFCAAGEQDPFGLLPAPEYTALVMNDSLRALRIQLRFLRMAIALHQASLVPLLPDEPAGTLEIEAAADGEFILRSKFAGRSRRSPYSRTVTLR